MSIAGWTLAAGLVLALYAGSLAALALAGRRADARALARLIPDCALLARRLLADRRVPRRHKLLLVALVLYLALPIDLVPDVVPLVGQLDDAVLIALVLRRVLGARGGDALREHWPGPPQTLALLARAVGVGVRGAPGAISRSGGEQGVAKARPASRSGRPERGDEG